MRHPKLEIAAVALALIATGQATQASLTTAASGTGIMVFGNPLISDIPVSYDVVFDSSTSLYTYLYAFTPLADYNIGEFTVNAQYVNSVLAAGTSISGSPYTLMGSISENGTAIGNVSWDWTPYTSTPQFVGFTSFFGPTGGTGSLNDDSTGPWGDNPGSGGTLIVVPGPSVPEPLPAIAAILVLVPCGACAMQNYRKKNTYK